MNNSRLIAGLLCLIILHAPGGGELRIDTAHIGTIRSVDGFKHHLAPGTNTVITVDGQNLGVIEMPDEVEAIIESCS